MDTHRGLTFTSEEAITQLRAFVHAQKEFVEGDLKLRLVRYLELSHPSIEQAREMVLFLYHNVIPFAYSTHTQRSMWQQSMRYQMLFMGSQLGLKADQVLYQSPPCQLTA